MLPELNFHLHDDGLGASASADDFSVTIERKPGRDCGYTQCTWMWCMKFERGGCMAYACLDSLSAAQCNAARIVGHMRGTHDCLGNELGPDGKIVERQAPPTRVSQKQDSLFAMEGK